MPLTNTIVAYNLSKKYPGAKKYALKGLELDIKPGEVYGFLGPNGAGKSTTIRLLMNFIEPTAGEAYILGDNVVAESVRVKSHVGYLSGDIALYNKMTGQQFLDYMAALQPLKNDSYQKKLIRLLDATLRQPLGKLSKGNRQKIAIIQAFMHEPEVLILDEPTSGLDPLMQEAFFEIVRDAKRRGASLFISSHNLSEVQKICDSVGFIRDGRLIAEQSINDLVSQSIQTYDISFAAAPPLAELKRLPKMRIKNNAGRHVTLQIKGDLKPLFTILARHKVNTLDRREASLEEEFLRFYREGKK